MRRLKQLANRLTPLGIVGILAALVAMALFANDHINVQPPDPWHRYQPIPAGAWSGNGERQAHHWNDRGEGEPRDLFGEADRGSRRR
jgi:hypothetical protein